MSISTLNPTPILSPCVKICTYDAARGLCTGCGRAGNEIGNWLNMTQQERVHSMELAANRLEKMNITR